MRNSTLTEPELQTARKAAPTSEGQLTAWAQPRVSGKPFLPCIAAVAGAGVAPAVANAWTQPSPGPVLRVALLIDSTHVSPLVADLVRWIDSQPQMSCALLVIPPQPAWPAAVGPRDTGSQRRPLRNLLWHLMMAIERSRVRRSGFKDQLGSPVILDNEPPSGGSFSFKAQAGESTASLARRLRSALGAGMPDLIVQIGSALPIAELALCATQGALKLVHGGGHYTGGGDTGFWEVLTQSPKTAFAVLHVPTAGGTPNTLVHGYLSTRTAFLMNQLALLAQLHQALKEALSYRVKEGAFPHAYKEVVIAPVRRARPTAQQLLSYAGAVAKRSFAIRAKDWLGSKEKWQVHFKHQHWSELSLEGAQAIPNPPGGFFADPFLRQTPDGLFCLVEEFRENTQRGVISALRLDAAGPVYLGQVLDEPFHLSFPYMFEYGGELFMCPETHEAGQIRLYKCKAFPLHWELHSVAMCNVAAVDTLVFQEGNVWCLLTGILPEGDVNRYPELHLFTAADPVSGQWVPHAANPIKADPEFARNAGLLHKDGKRYRVSQVCAFSSYGASVTVCEMLGVTPQGLNEAVVARFNAGAKRGNTGLHHLDHAGGVTAWDERRWYSLLGS
jgi:hypothetical protein